MRAAAAGDGRTPVRTLLEAKIRERNMTLEEFAEYAETFARENKETGTISARHLQRLLAPRPDSAPPNPRPATRRLLEHIFGVSLVELLAPPTAISTSDAGDDEFGEFEAGAANLARLIETATRVDEETIRLLADQIETTRRLDRRFGAATLLGALRLHAQHIESLFVHCTSGTIYRALAAVLADAHTLAGWQSLDRGEITAAWHHYRHACDAARAAESHALLAHALAEEAVVLADINRTTDSAEMSTRARWIGQTGEPLLRAWLAAAHGEALAADGQRDASLRAFDDAATRLPGSYCMNVRVKGLILRSTRPILPAGAVMPSLALVTPTPFVCSGVRLRTMMQRSAAQRRDFERILRWRISHPENGALSLRNTLPHG